MIDRIDVSRNVVDHGPQTISQENAKIELKGSFCKLLLELYHISEPPSVLGVVMSIERTSDRLRAVARAVPTSVPPLEGALLLAMMAIWLLG